MSGPQPEIDEAEERKAELEGKYEERRELLPGALKKLTNGCARSLQTPVMHSKLYDCPLTGAIPSLADEMRTYWFEIFECVRKILLILVPIFFEQDSPEQLTIGLIICFITFGMYMMYAPYEDSGDDLLAQVCQLQIFFSMLSSIILAADPESPAMGVILPILIFVTLRRSHSASTPAAFSAQLHPLDGLWHRVCTSGATLLGLRLRVWHPR